MRNRIRAWLNNKKRSKENNVQQQKYKIAVIMGQSIDYKICNYCTADIISESNAGRCTKLNCSGLKGKLENDVGELFKS